MYKLQQQQNQVKPVAVSIFSPVRAFFHPLCMCVWMEVILNVNYYDAPLVHVMLVYT